jgi:prepilin-type N-terminal cleavage/methylation domain-containing protein
MRKGFTLIELLIVVAIIAILAAIAVPNFLEAQTRSKVSRVKADLRTISTAVGSYLVDNNRLPPLWNNTGGSQDEFAYNRTLYQKLPTGSVTYAARLSSPVAYISSVSMLDPFNTHGEAFNGVTSEAGYAAWMLEGQLRDPEYLGWWKTTYDPTYQLLKNRNLVVDGKAISVAYILASPGPSQKWHTKFTGIIANPTWTQNYRDGKVPLYDPTNGTVSIGQIMRYE